MPIIALNGLLIQLPSAFYLAFKSGAGEFDERAYWKGKGRMSPFWGEFEPLFDVCFMDSTAIF